MFRTDVLESTILEELAQVGTCTIEELYEKLPYYSWGQVFSVVDRFTLQGIIVLKHPAPSRYLLSLAPRLGNWPKDAA